MLWLYTLNLYDSTSALSNHNVYCCHLLISDIATDSVNVVLKTFYGTVSIALVHNVFWHIGQETEKKLNLFLQWLYCIWCVYLKIMHWMWIPLKHVVNLMNKSFLYTRKHYQEREISVQSHTHTPSICNTNPALSTSPNLPRTSALSVSPAELSYTMRPSQSQWTKRSVGPSMELHSGAFLQCFLINTHNFFKGLHRCLSMNQNIPNSSMYSLVSLVTSWLALMGAFYNAFFSNESSNS